MPPSSPATPASTSGSTRPAARGGRAGRRSYGQYCGTAAALDRLGDRWTLLVLRELSFGPKRFTDIRGELPGLATNILTERLRVLEEDGLIEREDLPAPVSRTVYRLSRDGLRVLPVLVAMSEFGLPYLGDPAEGEVRPEVAVYGVLMGRVQRVGSLGSDLSIRFDLDGTSIDLRLVDGEIRRPAAGGMPDLRVTGSAAALAELARGADPTRLRTRLQVEGDRQAIERFAAVFDFEPRHLQF